MRDSELIFSNTHQDFLLFFKSYYFIGKVNDDTFEFGTKTRKVVLLNEISFLEVVSTMQRRFHFKGAILSLLIGFMLFFFDFIIASFSVLPFFYFVFFYKKRIFFIQIIYKIPSRDVIIVDVNMISEAKKFVARFNYYLRTKEVSNQLR